jgi:hypothetical protein
MIVCRIFTMLFLMCVTACGMCSSLFPLFRRSYDVASMPIPYHHRDSVYYWYMEWTTAGAYPILNYSRAYNIARTCGTDRTCFIAASALSTAAIGMCGVACMMSATWIYAGFDSCLHAFIIFISFLSFVCYVAAVGLMSYVYINETCAGTVNHVVALKNASPKYAIAEGFILLCVAAGGMLIALVLEGLSFCVCTNTDDYCGGRPRDSAAVMDRHNSIIISDGSVVTAMKAANGGYLGSRTESSLSRARGETSMSRRSSTSNLSRTSSSSSISSNNSSRSSRSSHSSHPSLSSRPSRDGHRRPAR